MYLEEKHRLLGGDVTATELDKFCVQTRMLEIVSRKLVRTIHVIPYNIIIVLKTLFPVPVSVLEDLYDAV